MQATQILADLTSRDVSKVRLAACEIISFGHDRDKVLPFATHVPEILEKTRGLKMGGIFAPNQRFVDHAVEIIKFHSEKEACPCALYVDYSYECYDPNREAEKHLISLQQKDDFYLCECLKCGRSFKVFEREGHYTWWEWQLL